MYLDEEGKVITKAYVWNDLSSTSSLECVHDESSNHNIGDKCSKDSAEEKFTHMNTNTVLWLCNVAQSL